MFSAVSGDYESIDVDAMVDAPVSRRQDQWSEKLSGIRSVARARNVFKQFQMTRRVETPQEQMGLWLAQEAVGLCT